MAIIEIDTDVDCRSPRRGPDERAYDAVDQIYFETGALEGALRSGGELSRSKRNKLSQIIRRLEAMS